MTLCNIKYGKLQQPLVGSNLIETLSEDGRCTIIEDNFKIFFFSQPQDDSNYKPEL